MARFLTGAIAALLLLVAPVTSVWAAPKFPPLTGRVVDNANILSPTVEAELTGKLAALEAGTSRQLVVVTVPDLQGYEIEDYGYQLGRAWGLGSKAEDDGALFIVAPKERKVRIEVGYGLEPVLTDALSSLILQTTVIPKFKAGDMSGGVVAGTDAIIDQLSAPDGEAKAQAAQAAAAPRGGGSGFGFAPFFPLLIIFVLAMLFRGRRGRRSGLASALPWIILGGLSGGGRGGGGWSGGGGGGGGFSGGGGSFGGGGSSGSW